MQDSENYELDPNFAVVCSFLERFGKYFGDRYADISIEDLKSFLEAPEVDEKSNFVSLHVALFRGIGFNHYRPEQWFKDVIRFSRDFPDGDDVLIKDKGYANIPISAKLRILKNLCEDQFEYNDRFNRHVNEELEEGSNLRHEPVGKDKLGRSYWFMLDKEGGLRLFRGWRNDLTKDETWNIVCCEVDELEKLIEALEDADSLKQMDPPVQKRPDMSPQKKISPKDLLSTATEDAANVMYFSSIMSSPRFYKPPKARTKAQILQDERKFDLPHCDVEITRLSKRQLRKYKKQNKPSLTAKNKSQDSKNKSPLTDKINCDNEKLNMEDSPVKEDLHTYSEQTGNSSENLNTDTGITAGDNSGKSSSNKETDCENSERADVENKIAANVSKERTSEENDRSAMDLVNDSSEMEKEIVCDSISNRNDASDSSEADKCNRVLSDKKVISNCGKENKEVEPLCDKSTCQAKSGTCVCKEGRTDSRHKGKCNTEAAQPVENEIQKLEKQTRENVSAEKEESPVSLINNKGDACSQQDVANNIDQKKTHVIDDTFNQKDSSGSGKHNKVPEDDKNVFDNAIQDLIQLEGKPLNEFKCENGKNNKAFIKEVSEKNDIKNVKRFLEGEQVDNKQDLKGTCEPDSDRSIDNDKQVIDHALKDLMQLEEMINQGSPSSTCLSPASSNDLSLSKGENRTPKTISSKENESTSVENTVTSVDEESEKFSSKKILPSRNDANNDEKSSSAEHDDLVCKADESKSNSGTENKDNEEGKLKDEDVSTDKLCDTRKSNDREKKLTDSIKSSKIEEGLEVQDSSVKTLCNGICDRENSDHSLACQDETVDDKKVVRDVSDKGFQCQKAQKKLDAKTMANEEKPELSTKIKQTCHNYKEELPVLTKMLNVIEGKNVVKSEEKSEAAGQTVPVKTENMKMINSKENVLNGENIKETVQIDEKKPLSMMVGEEMIQIEVASNNSDEESESETQKNVNNSAPVSDKSVKLGDHISGTAKHTGSSMKENVGKHEKTVKVSEVVQNRVSEYLKQSLQSSKLKAKSGQELPHAPVIDLTAEKQMVKALYTPKSSAINTSMPNIVLLPAGNSSHLPVNQRSLLVSTTPAVPVSNVQTTVSSVADLLRTIYVPTSVPSTMRTTLPASGVQFKTLNSVLASPVVSSRSSTYPVIGNMPGLRMILQNKPSGGPVTLPYIQTNAPRIIYAPSPRPTIITLQKPGIVGSSHIIQGKSMQNSSTPKQGNDTTVKSLLAKSLATPLNQNLQTAKMNTVVQPNVVNKGIIPPTVLQSSDMKKKEPTVSVHNVTIVIGRDGVHYDKATGKPYVYPPDQKYVIAGPKGKFYDRATGYEVNVPHSENLKHVPNTVYLASGVSFTQEALKKIMAKKRAKTKKVKKQKEEITTSDEEFEKMLDLEKSSGDESDDTNYDYEKISQHVRAAKDKKLPARRASLKTSDSEKEEDNGSNVENVPVKLGRNAKRAAARKCTNYAESLGQLNFTEEIIEEEATVEEPCKVCNKNEDPSTILLCDKCDGSYHMSCLSPPLSLVPLEDWFCPQCEHNMLIESLREKVKEVKKAQRRFNRGQDRISVKTFSIDSENILEVERRSCRTKREVSYNEANYDKMIQKAVKEMNKPKKDRSSSDSSDSETESDTKQTSKLDHKQQKKGKATKRQRDGTRKSRRVKKSSSSGKSKAKKRKLTSLEDDSGGSSSEYLESEGSESSDTEGPAPDQEDMAVGGIYFTSSGRKTKNVSYT